MHLQILISLYLDSFFIILSVSFVDIFPFIRKERNKEKYNNMNNYLKEVARDLRKNMTPAEKYLWNHIRRGEL